MRSLREKLEELNLAVGMTHRGNCPVCKRQKTFTVSNDNGTLLYNCYANSCNLSGAHRVGLSAAEIREFFTKGFNKEPKEAPAFVMPEHVVPDVRVQKYAQSYGLDADHLGLLYDVVTDRIVFPIKINGLVVDAIGRTVVNELPKWLRYGTARTAYVAGTSRTCVVVEDAISAAVVETLGGTGFAVLGTTLLREHIEMLRSYDEVVVALDPDACKKTIEITRELKSNGINALAFYLCDDLKYRDEKDVELLLPLLKD